MVTILDKIAKDTTIDLGSALLYSLIAIALVFLALVIIIIVMEIIFRGEGYFSKKFKALSKRKVVEQIHEERKSIEVDMNDEDAQIAIVVASIDYRNQIKKDVKVVSIRRIEE